MLSRYPFRPPTEIPFYQSPGRPLSDIRETTEPSLVDGHNRDACAGVPRSTLSKRVAQHYPKDKGALHSPLRTRKPRADGHSDHKIVLENVPPRSSSRTRIRHMKDDHCPSISSRLGEGDYTSEGLSGLPTQVRNLDRAASTAAASVLQFEGSDHVYRRKAPSRTLVRLPKRTLDDILEHPILLHPRIRIDLQASAPLFVGGSTVEGTLRILVDEADRIRYRKTLCIERASVDVLGIEEMTSDKRYVFLALSNAVIDLMHPPPPGMVESTNATFLHDRSWILMPSIAMLPFIITLPLKVGPPTFTSKHARIKYILSATLIIRDSGRQLSVRCTQPTFILSVHDPETALASLPTPLTATDEYTSRSRPGERIIVTAGLHRKVWVSGTTIFADVHIINNSRKAIKRIELQLERLIFCRRNAAVGTLKASPGQGCHLGQLERSVVCRGTLRCGQQGWSGVDAYSTCLRTCDLELPRGHTSVNCNEYFEVRFYLNVVVSTAHHKIAVVKLPISLIHMNSLDVPTNSVEQVAAAIDESRGPRSCDRKMDSSSPSESLDEGPKLAFQGRAFSAPRTRSSEKRRARERDLEHLTKELEASPRKSPRRDYKAGDEESPPTFRCPLSNRRGRIFVGDEAEALRRQFNAVRESSYSTYTFQKPTKLYANTSEQRRGREVATVSPESRGLKGREKFERGSQAGNAHGDEPQPAPEDVFL